MKMAKAAFRTAVLAVIVTVLVQIAAVPAFAEEAQDLRQIQAGDILCFGTPDENSGFDGKWLVLDSEHTNIGTDGMFLVSLNLIGDDQGEPLLFRDIGDVSVSFSDRGEAYAQAHPGVTDYRGSDIQLWCDEFYEKHFTEAERLAILPTQKSDDGIVIPGFTIPLPGATSGTVDFDPAEKVLDGDRFFLPSVEEITNEAYGFTDNASKVAQFKGENSGYWLRSPHIPTFPLDVGFVFSFGAVMDYPVNANSMFEMGTYARVACNLDSSRIGTLDELLVTEGKTIWRVTMKGDEHNGRSYDLALPVIGEVLDLAGMFRMVFAVAICVIVLLIALTVWLIIRHRRKKLIKSGPPLQ